MSKGVTKPISFSSEDCSVLNKDAIESTRKMSVVFSPRNPVQKRIELMQKMFGNDYYICRF
ncbi:hypothetical protein HanIR_Chr09g0392561 [Helianthus annuus]|nr:hypothetical protein HanIR_Chr09g0392561 [Helianthus annuus]